MKIYLIRTIYIIIFSVSFITSAQIVKIGDNPSVINGKAVLELESTNKGILVPRLSTAERNAISLPANGLLIFNKSIGCFEFRAAGGTVNSAGAWYSACTGATCTVAAIVGQPVGGTVCSPATSTLSVSATGTISGYQWQKDNVDIPGANSSTYSALESGTYRVFVIGQCGNATSNSVVVTVNSAPVIIQNPSNITINVENETAAFTGAATGSGTLSYQWEISRDNGVSWSNLSDNWGYGANNEIDHAMVLAGSTTPNLVIKWVTTGEDGRMFRLKVTSTSTCTPNPVYTTAATLRTTNSPAYIVNSNLCGGLSGWTSTGPVSGSTGNPCGMYLNPTNGSSGGVIYRDFTTVAGASYTFSTRILVSGFARTVSVRAYNGAGVTLLTTGINTGDSLTQITFTATGTTTRIRIADDQGSSTNAFDAIVFLARFYQN